MVYWKRGSAFGEGSETSLSAGQQDTLLDMANISASAAVLVAEAKRQKFGHPWRGRASVWRENFKSGAKDMDQMLNNDFVSILKYSVIDMYSKWTAAFLTFSSECVRGLLKFVLGHTILVLIGWFNIFCDLICFSVLCLTCWFDLFWQLYCSLLSLLIMTLLIHIFQCYFCLSCFLCFSE